MIYTNNDWRTVNGEMTVVYATEEPPEQYEKSIFLAGPTPRDKYVQSWRKRALEILDEYGYDGVVFIPEDRPDKNGVTTFHGDYDNQVEWENTHLHMADCIVFWVPRRMTEMPALTTNTEWGVWQDSGKAVFGAPITAEKTRYQALQAKALGITPRTTLEETLCDAIDFVGDGALRRGGEREVPLFVWQTPSFQNWYAAQRGASNKLCHARLLWVFHSESDREELFLWALQPDIYVAEEDRHKTDEIVLARPDLSTVIAFCPGRSLDMTEIVLVREFRSAVSNPTGFVWEAPGGSSFEPGMTPEMMAAEEFHEETGLYISPERFVFHEARQLNATLLTHQANVFSLELTRDEINRLKQERGIAHGDGTGSEQTYVEVQTLAEIRSRNYVDWSMLGMIMQVLLHP